MSTLEQQLRKAVEDEGIDPITGEALAEAGSEETLNNDQQQGDQDGEDNKQEVEQDEVDSGSDSTEEETDPESAGGESEGIDLSEDEQALLEGAEQEKGMINVPSSVLKKLRKKASEEKQRAEEAQQKLIQELEARNQQSNQIIDNFQQPQQQSEPQPEPDRELEPELWAAWQADKTRLMVEGLTPTIQEMQQRSAVQAAQNQFNQLENLYEQQNAGYIVRKKKFIEQEIKSQKILNPTANEAQIRDQLNNDILMQASNLVNAGLNPIQTFDSLMKERGITDEEPKKAVKPNIKNIAKNSTKSKSISDSGDRSDAGTSAVPNADEFLGMTPKELIALQKKMGRKKFDKLVEKLGQG